MYNKQHPNRVLPLILQTISTNSFRTVTGKFPFGSFAVGINSGLSAGTGKHCILFTWDYSLFGVLLCSVFCFFCFTSFVLRYLQKEPLIRVMLHASSQSFWRLVPGTFHKLQWNEPISNRIPQFGVLHTFYPNEFLLVNGKKKTRCVNQLFTTRKLGPQIK